MNQEVALRFAQAEDLYSEERETKVTGKILDSECSKDLEEAIENVFRVLEEVYLGKHDEHLFLREGANEKR